MTTDIYESIARLEQKTAELFQTVNHLKRSYRKRPNLTMEGGVYQIENIETGEKYVGSAANIRTRISTHFSKLRAGEHESQFLQTSFDNSGEYAFTVTVLDLIESREDRFDKEQEYLDIEGSYTLNVLRNSRGRKGVPHTAETRSKMAAKKTGEFHPKFKGYYVTPWGTFASPYAASLECPDRAIAHSTVTIYCEKPDTVINRNMYGTSRYLKQNFGEGIIGMTYRELGFSFVKPNYEN